MKISRNAFVSTLMAAVIGCSCMVTMGSASAVVFAEEESQGIAEVSDDYEMDSSVGDEDLLLAAPGGDQEDDGEEGSETSETSGEVSDEVSDEKKEEGSDPVSGDESEDLRTTGETEPSPNGESSQSSPKGVIQTGQEVPTGTIIIFVASGVVLIAAVVVSIVVSKKRSKKDDDDE